MILSAFFYINSQIRAVVSGLRSSSTVSTYTFRRGEKQQLAIGLTTPTTTYASFTTYASLKLSAKYNSDWDGFEIFSVTSFSTVTTAGGSSTPTRYVGMLDFSGTTLSNLFAPKNTPSVTLQAEFEWTDRLDGVTYRVNSQPFKFIIQNDLID